MAKSYDPAALAPEMEKLYARMKPTRTTAIDNAARRCLRFKSRYMAVSRRTGVPWEWLAVTHMREANNSFAGVLHNGDKIIGTGKKTYRVPKGRGPFSTWEDAAVDALEMKNLTGWRRGEWTIGRMLAEAERFNGYGYRNKRKRSPYVWGGTNLQQPGKYIRDHVWSSTHVDTQLGVAPVLARIHELDNVRSVPKGKTSGLIRRIRRGIEGAYTAFAAWLTSLYENMTLDVVMAYLTDPRTWVIFLGGFALWLALFKADRQVVKAYKEGNYKTNEELDMEAE